MRRHPLFLLSLFHLIACTSGDDRGAAGDDPSEPRGGTVTGDLDGPAPATSAAVRIDVGSDSPAAASTDAKIHVRSDNAPLLVVFRDGPTAAWQAATQLTPTHYQAAVHGPYMVGVVCESRSTVGQAPLHFDTIITWQVARTLDDPRDLTPPCTDHTPYNGLSGQTTPSALVQIGELAINADATGRYITYAKLGTRDIIASSANKLLIHRNLPIDYGNVPQNPTVDVAGQGKALATTKLLLPNVVTGETVQAQVHVATATTDTDAPIYISPPQTSGDFRVNTADIKVAADASLDEPGDSQVVTASATLGASVRSLARDFRLYGDTDFTLPPALAGTFAYNAATQQVSASWPTLPETTALHLVLDGATTDPGAYSRHELHVTAAYLTAVNPTSAKVDLALPGYKAAWRVDTHQPYTRTLSAQHVAGGDVATSAVTETTSAP